MNEHRQFLWALCYRMTGDPADADDLVQETFARALQRPPPDAAAPLRPWLTRVAMNLALDHLRRRRRTPYAGIWLPALIETDAAAAQTPAARYDLLESATVAFLLALEALSPIQRAVLLLRDVFDEPSRETAIALGISEANVRAILVRSRARMAAYDANRLVPTRDLQERTRGVLVAFMGAIAAGDVDLAKSMLAESVRAAGDGAGRYKSGLAWIHGREKVARLYLHLSSATPPDAASVRLVNGLPALVISLRSPPGRVSPRAVLQLQLDSQGKVSQVHAVVVPEKLTRVRPPDQ